MTRYANVTPFKARKRFRRFSIAVGGLAVVGLVFTGFERVQQPDLPTVTAFTPSLPSYSSRETTVAQRGPGAYRVIDGDTIEAAYGVKYRLLGYDTPETYFSKCDEELVLGKKATRRLKELLASGEVKIVETWQDGQIWALARLPVREWA